MNVECRIEFSQKALVQAGAMQIEGLSIKVCQWDSRILWYPLVFVAPSWQSFNFAKHYYPRFFPLVGRYECHDHWLLTIGLGYLTQVHFYIGEDMEDVLIGVQGLSLPSCCLLTKHPFQHGDGEEDTLYRISLPTFLVPATSIILQLLYDVFPGCIFQGQGS